MLREIGGGPDRAGALALERAALVLSEVRRTKSEAKRPLTTPVVQATVRDTSDNLTSLRTSESDVRAAGFVELLTLLESDAFSVTVDLAPAEAKL
jgi:valyl-tRNA synthetase